MISGKLKTSSFRMKAAFLTLVFICAIPVSVFSTGEKFSNRTETQAENFSVITIDHTAILLSPHAPDKPRLTPSSPVLKPDETFSHVTFIPRIADSFPESSHPGSPLYIFARFSTSTFF
ncbi:MAG TPA: hypothetical protein PKK43_10920 [Spirochaetota bacterium]|nr:hypothetical protein [Spirochaetota bacterium]